MKIIRVILWTNGTTMVFDEKGEQVPYLQGKYEKQKERILSQVNEETIFEFGKWNEMSIEVTREQWSKNTWGIYPEQG